MDKQPKLMNYSRMKGIYDAHLSEMKGMLGQMGGNFEGLKKDQYKIGLDVQQTVFDGGAIKSQKEIARQQGEVQRAQNEVNLYYILYIWR